MDTRFREKRRWQHYDSDSGAWSWAGAVFKVSCSGVPRRAAPTPRSCTGRGKDFNARAAETCCWCLVLVLRWLVSWNDDVKTLKSSWFRNG